MERQVKRCLLVLLITVFVLQMAFCVQPAGYKAFADSEYDTVLAFTSDVHNGSGNESADRLGVWIDTMRSMYGKLDGMGFCGDMGSVSNTTETQFWQYAKKVIDTVAAKGVPACYTTGNHEFNPGNYKTTTNSVKNNYIVGAEGLAGDNYRIYCLGTDNWDNNQDNYTQAQVDDDTEIDATENSAQDIIPFNVGGIEFNMIFVEGGTFNMGATPEQGDADDNEKPVHTVTLSDYYIGETQVTQGLWQAVMGNNPSYFKKGDNYPVEQVSWNDAQDFIKKLNAKTGKSFCLPTEAEWEFAARGGNLCEGFRYSGGNDLDKVAVYEQNSDSLSPDNPACGTHPVKTKDCNELGIYDMSGNVWEWCQDSYGDYSSRPVNNPQFDSTNPARVLRGGSWRAVASFCRVSTRQYNNPDFCNYNLGFRLGLVC